MRRVATQSGDKRGHGARSGGPPDRASGDVRVGRGHRASGGDGVLL